MKKKVPAGRVPEKKKTEKIIKKIKADLAAPSGPGRKRKEAATPVSSKKASKKTVRLKTSAGKEKVRKKDEPEKRKKTAKEAIQKKEKPSAKKAVTKKKKEIDSKKAKKVAVGKKGVQLQEKVPSVKKAKPAKPSVKAVAGKKKTFPASEKKRILPKPSVKPVKKVKVATGTKTVIKKKPAERKKPLAAKKKKAGLSEETKKENVMKIFRPEVRAQERKKTKAGGTYGERELPDSGSLKTGEAKKGREEMDVYSAGEGILPLASFESLPSEYGENSIHLITINPQRVFAFWEVKEDTVKEFQGTLTLRQYDITDLDLDRRDVNRYVDREVNERTGTLYLDVEPSKDYMAEIGILYPGDIFITIARSHKVSTPFIAAARSEASGSPHAKPPEEAEFIDGKLATEIRAGYSGNQ